MSEFGSGSQQPIKIEYPIHGANILWERNRGYPDLVRILCGGRSNTIPLPICEDWRPITNRYINAPTTEVRLRATGCQEIIGENIRELPLEYLELRSPGIPLCALVPMLPCFARYDHIPIGKHRFAFEGWLIEADVFLFTALQWRSSRFDFHGLAVPRGQRRNMSDSARVLYSSKGHFLIFEDPSQTQNKTR